MSKAEIAGACHIRTMCEADVVQAAQVESTLSPSPWSEQNFADCLRHQYVCLVAQTEARLAGFCVVSIASGEAQILNIGVDQRHHRNGIGSDLITQAVAQCVADDVLEMFLEVRESNQAAIAFYKRHDFEKVGLRKDYYNGVLAPLQLKAARKEALKEARENAIVMRRDL